MVRLEYRKILNQCSKKYFLFRTQNYNFIYYIDKITITNKIYFRLFFEIFEIFSSNIRSIISILKVNLELEIEIDRDCDFATSMLHFRDQLHSVASLANPHSTTPRLYDRKTGEPIVSNENYKEMIQNVNSVDLVFK